MIEIALLALETDLLMMKHRQKMELKEMERKAKRQAEYNSATHERRMEMLAEDQIEATKKLTEEIRRKDMSPKHYHEHRTTNIF